MFGSVLESSSCLSVCSLRLPGLRGDEVDNARVDSWRG
jgi:hypothetical protein